MSGTSLRRPSITACVSGCGSVITFPSYGLQGRESCTLERFFVVFGRSYTSRRTGRGTGTCFEFEQPDRGGPRRRRSGAIAKARFYKDRPVSRKSLGVIPFTS